jgi:hypothetical protein
MLVKLESLNAQVLAACADQAFEPERPERPKQLKRSTSGFVQ